MTGERGRHDFGLDAAFAQERGDRGVGGDRLGEDELVISGLAREWRRRRERWFRSSRAGR